MNPFIARGRSASDAVHETARRFRPYGTIRCSNSSFFGSQLARDLGCLLDVDDDVVAWCCRPYGMDNVLIEIGWKGSPPDFLVTYSSGRDVYVHAVEDEGDPEVTEAAACRQIWHRFAKAQDIRAGCRLQNAKDLLRYANYQTPLGDRIRLLAALEQEGSATVAECLSTFREIAPMAGLSSLILNRFVAVDLDAELITPHTVVRVFGS
ncbi:hypothetical protein [Rhizobium ruizarguesonis]|uniref:hypothetical protein n=1 Tax=Rhizobium ruizarguesonis TaxID=2081791 RepID=UPI0010322D7D|nr:hypothetical protein [Rhizobium ruizarguesonis]TBD47117.1 hypothetical protein ELH17_08490 [Rhizobium ruizarguesonis]